MSRRRTLGIALGIVLAAIVAVSAIGIGWLYLTLRPLGEFFEYGLLGPPDRRQTIEVPDHGFAISFADDWMVQIESKRLVTDRSHVDPVLLAGPEHGVPSCRVGVAPDGASRDAESFLLAWTADRAPDSEVGISTAPGLSEDVLGIGVRQTDGTFTAAYWVPHEDHALIISCEVDLAVDRPPDDDSVFTSDAQAMILWGMPSIVESIEPLTAVPPGPTDGALDRRRRVETPGGSTMTLPEGWVSLPPEPDDDPEAQPLALAQLWPWRSRPSVTVVRLEPDSVDAVESCTFGGVVLADYMGSWDEAPLESIVALLGPTVMLGDARGAESEPRSVAYLDVPAGRVARVDFADDGSYRSVYVLPQHKTLQILVCDGPERGVDAWDSLARSFDVTPTSAHQ